MVLSVLMLLWASASEFMGEAAVVSLAPTVIWPGVQTAGLLLAPLLPAREHAGALSRATDR